MNHTNNQVVTGNHLNERLHPHAGNQGGYHIRSHSNPQMAHLHPMSQTQRLSNPGSGHSSPSRFANVHRQPMGPPDSATNTTFKRQQIEQRTDYAFGQESDAHEFRCLVPTEAVKVSPLAKNSSVSNFSEFSEVSNNMSSKFSDFPNFSNFAPHSDGSSTGRGGRFEYRVNKLERKTFHRILPQFPSFHDCENWNPDNRGVLKNEHSEKKAYPTHEKLFLYQARQQQNQHNQTSSRSQQHAPQVQVPIVQLAPPRGSDNQNNVSNGGSWSQMLKK